jgi:hypothetical protein
MERYLREFRPRAIRSLAVAPQSRNVLWRRLAAAAAIAACAAALFWLQRRELRFSRPTANVQPTTFAVRSERQSRTTFNLTTIALMDSKNFDALLAEESRKSLPNFQEEQSMLKVLAKD